MKGGCQVCVCVCCILKRKRGVRTKLWTQHLGQHVPLELGVSDHCMRNPQRDDVAESLDLVQHSVGVGHAASVLSSGAAVSADDTINFLMHPFC